MHNILLTTNGFITKIGVDRNVIRNEFENRITLQWAKLWLGGVHTQAAVVGCTGPRGGGRPRSAGQPRAVIGDVWGGLAKPARAAAFSGIQGRLSRAVKGDHGRRRPGEARQGR
jgi:hypothetical protein